MQRGHRIPYHTGNALGLQVLLPVAGVAGENDGARLREIHQQRLMAGRVAVRPEHGQPRCQFRVAVEQAPAIARQVEVLPIVEGRQEGRGKVGRRVFVALHEELRLAEQLGAAGMVIVQMGEHNHVNVSGSEADGVEAVDEEVRVGEARHGVAPEQTWYRPRGEPGIEEHGDVDAADEIAGDGDLDSVRREITIEEAGTVETDEAVLQRVQGLYRHGGLC
jgi:hypothetical protein